MIDPEVTNVPKLDNGEEKQAEEKKNKMMMMTMSEIVLSRVIVLRKK